MQTLDFTPVPKRLIFSKLQTWLLSFSVKQGTPLDLRQCRITAFISLKGALIKKLSEGAGIQTANDGASFILKNDLINITDTDVIPLPDVIVTDTFQLDVVLTTNEIDTCIASFQVQVRETPLDSEERIDSVNSFEFDLKTLSYSLTISAVEAAQNAKESEIAAKLSEINTFQNKLDVQNLINQVSLGTPKGIFANLTELNTANPDPNFIYVTVDNGRWNYHNGIAFVSGGQYQALVDIQQELGISSTSLMSQNAIFETINKEKALFSPAIQPPIHFEKFTNQQSASVTYENGVVTATHNSIFMVASSIEELHEIIINNSKQWICIGYSNNGKAIIVSVHSDNIGNVRELSLDSSLSDTTQLFPTTRIPANATKVKVQTINDHITISYTQDDVTWTVWGTVSISNIAGYTRKALGFLSYNGYSNPRSIVVYSYKRIDTKEHTISLDDIEEVSNISDKYVLIGGGSKGIQKISDTNMKLAFDSLFQDDIEAMKILFSSLPQPPIHFEKFTNEQSASVTYENGVVTANHNNMFLIASSIEELREIVINNSKQWICIGYSNNGKAIIVSVHSDNIGNVLKIRDDGDLSDTTQLFPTTRIPANATKVKVQTINDHITISYTQDNVTWIVWGTVAISNIPGYTRKALGFLSYNGYSNPRSIVVHSYKRIDTEDTDYSIELDNIPETTSNKGKFYILGGGEKGIEKYKITPDLGVLGYLGDSIIEQGTEMILEFYSGIATVHVSGHGGFCYGQGGAGTLNNPNFLNYLISNNPNYIFLQAGTNDYGNNVQIGSRDSTNINETCGGLNAIINQLQTSLPECRLIVSTPSPRYYGGSTQLQLNGINKSYEEYVNAIIDVASRHSIPVQDRFRKFGVNIFNKNVFTTDGLHLTPKGYKRMLTDDINFLRNLV